MSLRSLAEALRNEFTTLGIPTVLEMAIVSTSGKVLYSDLSKAAMERISPLYNNLSLMGQRDHMSLTLDASRTIIVSRVSNRAILITLTDKKMGIILTKMEGVADKFGRLLDEFIASEESKLQSGAAISEEVVETPIIPLPEPAVEEIQSPSAAVSKTSATVIVPPGSKPSVSAAPSVPDIVNEAMMIIDEARKTGVTLRALGGMGVAMHCPSTKQVAPSRKYPDIDLVGHANEAPAIRKVLEGLGFELRSATSGVSPLDEAIGRMLGGLGLKPVEEFDAPSGARRLTFIDKRNNIDIDVFLDVFEMCHKFDFKNRLDLDKYTLSLADLLMTKLQIVDLVGKDVLDVMAILLDHDYDGGDPEKIDLNYIAGLCADDWGLWKTFTMNVEKVAKLVDDYSLRDNDKRRIKSQLADFLKRLEDKPKSSKWQRRAKVGEKSKWYETVEEVKR